MTHQNLADITHIVLHHSASPRDTTTLEKIRGWHLDRGFADVGYHRVVESDGAVRDGRPLDVIPAAQKGANTNSIAICAVGDNTRAGEGWNDAQRLAIRTLVAKLRDDLGRRVPLVGHRDVAPSECPGLDVREAFPDLV